MSLRPAVFLDRDGTLIVEQNYLSDPDGVVFVPNVFDALHRMRAAGYLLIVVTNQGGIARGYYTVDDYHAVAARVDAGFEAAGVPVDGTYFCPHHVDFTGPCDCRKPATGMYERAAAEHGIDLEASWYTGDKITDVLPALALGGRGVLVRTGYGREQEHEAPDGVSIADDVSGVADLVTADGKAR